MALACRFRVALASNAPLQIGSPEIQLGLLPAWGAITRLPRLLAPRDALNLLLTGNPIGFLQAKSQGLVDRLFSQDEQARIAETLARGQPRARRMPRPGAKSSSSRGPRRTTSRPTSRGSARDHGDHPDRSRRGGRPPPTPRSSGAGSWHSSLHATGHHRFLQSPPSLILTRGRILRARASCRQVNDPGGGTSRVDDDPRQVEPAATSVEHSAISGGDDVCEGLTPSLGCPPG